MADWTQGQNHPDSNQPYPWYQGNNLITLEMVIIAIHISQNDQFEHEIQRNFIIDNIISDK